eukprot:Selendium_serpulae@DN6520_c3_g1_i2.p1
MTWVIDKDTTMQENQQQQAAAAQEETRRKVAEYQALIEKPIEGFRKTFDLLNVAQATMNETEGLQTELAIAKSEVDELDHKVKIMEELMKKENKMDTIGNVCHKVSEGSGKCVADFLIRELKSLHDIMEKKKKKK